MGNEHKFILDSKGNVVAEPDVIRWAEWFETHTKDRILARTEIRRGETVSTVFLGLDQRFGGKGPPVLWETMMFGGPLNREMNRYTSEKAALKGHQAMCERAKKAHSPS